jgi:hypothetical protein
MLAPSTRDVVSHRDLSPGDTTPSMLASDFATTGAR